MEGQSLEKTPAGTAPTQVLASRKALQEGYSAHLSGKDEQAYNYFLKAYELDSSNTAALKELGYADVKSGRLDKAIARFREALSASPADPRTRLDLGYALQNTGDQVAARSEFQMVAQLPGEFQEQAIKAMDAMQPLTEGTKPPPAPPQKKHYTEFFASPYYMTRFHDLITSAEARFYVKAGDNSPLSFYAGARYVGDSRSKGGIAPQIYNDNAFSAGVGARIDSKIGISLAAESFLAFNLIKTGDHRADTEGDFRVVAAGYWDVQERICGPIGLLTAETLRDKSFYTSLGGSIGYYSRYRDNVIGQFLSMEGWNFYKGERSRLSVYLRSMAGYDTNADFFNNLAEVGPGIEFQPFAGQNLKFRADYVIGAYFGREGRDKNPYGPDYRDTRLSLNYGVRF